MEHCTRDHIRLPFQLCILVLLLFGPRTEAQTCPGPELQGCSCRGTEVRCESVDLVSVPVVPPNTTILIVRGGNITHLERLPKYDQLVRLDLSDNNIRTIDPQAFRNVPNIDNLLLHKNYLNFSTLPPNLFDSMSSLQFLDISDNFMWHTTWSYRDDLMVNLSSVVDLTIDGMPYAKLGQGFRGLISLKTLTFQSKIRRLFNDSFESLKTLPITTLRLWSGWLESIASHTFAYLPNLETLDMSFNPRLGFSGAAEAWPGLEFTNIKSLIFNHSAHFDTAIITMNETFFHGLNNTNLTSVSIDANTIVTMVGVFNIYVPNLQHLAISYNRLTQVTSIILDIAQMKNLVTLDASHQAIRHNRTEREIMAGIDLTSEISLKIIEELDLDIDSIVSDVIDRDPQLQPFFEDSCRLRNCLLDVDEYTDPEPLPFSIPLPLIIPPTTESVNLSASLSISVTTLPTVLVINALNIKYLDYSFNGLIDLANPVIVVNDSVNNMTLNLRGNGLRNCSDYYGLKGTSMSNATEAMFLGDNNLGEMLSKLGTKNMAGLVYLKYLELSNNHIKSLPYDSFQTFDILRVLDLSHNSLRRISFDLDFLSQIERLDLSSNLLAYLNKTTTSKITNIAKTRQQEGRQFELNLKENPFICSCDTRDFLQWVVRSNNKDGLHITDVDQLLCEYGGDIVSFYRLESIVKTLNRKCNITKFLLIAFIPSAFIALVVGLSLFAKRHKWDIKFWFMSLTIKRKKAQARRDELKQRYDYDAFVSYASSDETIRWIRTHLIPNTEKEAQYSLLIHDRDFVPGNPITENILMGIQGSAKVLLIIDRQFLKSEWCKYETHMSHCESIDRGRDVVIAILLEPEAVLLREPSMYSSLKSLLKKRTYIEWPKNPGMQRDFWIRLHRAIKDPILKPLQCMCGRPLERQFGSNVATNEQHNVEQSTTMNFNHI